MQIQFKMDGGIAFFPGLSEPISLDTEDLPAVEADELERLVKDAGFFDLPASTVAPPKGAADYRRYTIHIQAKGRSRTLDVTDPVEDPHIRDLVGFLKTKMKELRSGKKAE